MRKQGFLIFISWIILSSLTFGQEIYQWVDEKGAFHFTDDLSLVPEKYRNQVQKRKPSKEPSPLLSPQVTKEEEKEKEPKSAPEQKDLMGRGEEWWRSKAKEWNEKLKSAQKNLEETQTTLKTKENELEEIKFKSIFHRTRVTNQLKTDIKNLQEKEKELERQIEEAKNMLENVIPTDAEDYRANPDWLKIDK